MMRLTSIKDNWTLSLFWSKIFSHFHVFVCRKNIVCKIFYVDRKTILQKVVKCFTLKNLVKYFPKTHGDHSSDSCHWSCVQWLRFETCVGGLVFEDFPSATRVSDLMSWDSTSATHAIHLVAGDSTLAIAANGLVVGNTLPAIGVGGSMARDATSETSVGDPMAGDTSS